MSLFRKAGEKYEETKRAFGGGTDEEEGADPFVCEACGERLTESVAYCPHCGEAAVEPVEAVESAESVDTDETEE